jgi:hypothetical protein
MTAYFCDGTNGSDSNDGLAASTGGGHGPVATIGKLIAASGLMTSGDVGWVAPKDGGYRQFVTMGVTPTSEMKLIGDVHRAQNWAPGTPNGPVIWSAWTTNDHTSPATTSLLIGNGKNFLTFEDIWFMGVSNPAVLDFLSVVGSHHLTFRRCVVQGRWTDAVFGFSYRGDGATDPNLLFEDCIWIAGSTQCSVDCPKSAGSNYTATVTHRNNLFYGSQGARGIEVQSSGAGTGHPQGPWVITHCSAMGNISSLVDPRNSDWAANAIKIYNCFAVGQALGSGSNNGVVLSDFNRIVGNQSIQASAVGQNDCGGGGTNAHISPLLIELGQSMLWGLPPKPPFSIWPGSPFNSGFGESGSAQDDYDISRRPRPSGGFVRGFETASTVTGTATSGTTSSLTKTGAGWTVNAFTGYVLTLTGGTGAGQRRWVASNTATVLTPNYNFLTAPDATTTFSLDAPGQLKTPGCYEPHDLYIPGGASAADGASGNCIEVYGPCDIVRQLTTPNAPFTISVKVKWDSNHGDTNKPRAIMFWQPSIGVDDAADATRHYHEIKTATGTAGSGYETLTFTSITPTAGGYVRILLQARSAKGNGICYWDSWVVAV